jgi:glycosyltransferase involved in cell wall biosynthesis
MKLSIVSPVYEAEAIVDELVARIIEAVSEVTDDFEIILVEDGGSDNSWIKIQENCKKNSKIKGIKLSRNFGQHYAITAGISKATGDNIILMDCDLQDDPRYIHSLVSEAEKGYEIVFTKRTERKHGMMKSFNSWLFNKFFRILSEKKYDVNAGSMVLFSKRVGTVFLQLKDKDRLYIQMLKWLGFNSKTISVEHKPRFAGRSSYNFFKLLSMAVQGWTSHSARLLRLSIYLGIGLSLCSFLAAMAVVIKYFLYDLQPGWPSIIITVLFSTGLILLSIGVTGIYIGKVFEQSKDRPLFIIEKEINTDAE